MQCLHAASLNASSRQHQHDPPVSRSGPPSAYAISMQSRDSQDASSAADDLLDASTSSLDAAPLAPAFDEFDFDSSDLFSLFPLTQLPSSWNDLHFFPAPSSAAQTLPTTESSNPPPRKKRGRPYIGCLTCKERKIKCDERRPVCYNCERSRHYACLGWVDRVEPSGSPKNYTNIASMEPASKRVRHASGAQIATTISSRGRQQISIQHRPDPDSNQDSIIAESTQVHVTAENDQVLVSAGVLEAIENVPVDGALEHQTVREASATGTESCLPVLCDDEDADLIKHYKNVVSHIMMPTIDPSRNPWLQLYLPMALKDCPRPAHLALRHALMSVSAHHKARTSHTSHSIHKERAEAHRKTATQLLRNASADCTEIIDPLEKCSLLAAALSIITIGVFSGDQSDAHPDIEMAKLIFEGTGGESFWRSGPNCSILYQLFRCYAIVASTTKVRLDEGVDGDDLVEGITESPTSVAPSEVGNTHRAEEGRTEGAFQDAEHYVLDVSFGIGLGSISSLVRIMHVASICSRHKDYSKWPSDLQEVVRTIETSLYAAETNPAYFSGPTTYTEVRSPRVEPSIFDSMQPSTSVPKAVSDELIENHQWAFHYAVILYLHRVIRPSEDRLRETRIKSAQGCVDQVLERLENIDCLTRGTDVRPANTLWPAFIAACEAVDIPLRHRALIWFARASKCGIGNIAAAKRIVMEVWRRVDRYFDNGLTPVGGLGPIDWRHVMAEMQTTIMLT
ncbi:hypothetical protein IQ07DRAFT_629947 [Pyrenochaeta sp. DS3sAY3a]|nr:hypothetical protein IQ07DRAFT_629947 [Pyrenochaeta sp. DS3sAY3a]